MKIQGNIWIKSSEFADKSLENLSKGGENTGRLVPKRELHLKYIHISSVVFFVFLQTRLR